jgi:hypothetical protein
MRRVLLLAFLVPVFCFGQQNLQSLPRTRQVKLSDEVEKSKSDTNTEDGQDSAGKIPVFSILGIANLNQETLKSFNAGGKASIVVRPFIRCPKNTSTHFTSISALAVYASFNKSASNNDSVVQSKLIFPELGSSSFIGTVQWEKYKMFPNGKTHSVAAFFELGIKSIQTDSSENDRKIFFDALNYTVGFKYGFNYAKNNPFDVGKQVNLGFYIAPFISAFNIPDEDRDDYNAIMLKNATVIGNAGNLSDFVLNIGVKTGFHFNGMEFFADLRHVLGGEKVPIRELRGFHANIGFVFNADVLNFY